MDLVAKLDTPYPPARLFAWVEDLARYPRWLVIVPRAVPEPGVDDAWSVDLRGRVGPFARSKRLRMVRTIHQEPRTVRFERAERDGRRHSSWVLTADVEPVDGGSRLTMRLYYGGSLWGPVLERLLGDEIEHSKSRLLALIQGQPS